VNTRLLLGFIGGIGLGVEAPEELARGLKEGFTSLFARRYLPVKEVGIDGDKVLATLHWRPGSGFGIEGYRLSDKGVDEYVVSGEPPAPYTNEPPVFFVLQVAARSYARSGLLLLTDSVTLYDPVSGNAALLLGYPHGGKSTVAALALTRGLRVVSTENTVARVSPGGLEVLGGTEVLLYHPRVEERYKVKPPIEPSDVTRHGYRVLDLAPYTELDKPARITHIFVLHCSFASHGASLEPVKGRKIAKTLWHFASSLIRGDDYYDPHPLSLTSKELDERIAGAVREVASRYTGRFYEAYGAHDKVLDKIIEMLREARG